MQHRAEDFLLQIGNGAHFERLRRHQIRKRRCGLLIDRQFGFRRLVQQRSGFFHQTFAVAANAVEGFAVDDRADIGGQLRRVARDQLLRGAADHPDHMVGDLGVHTQQAQRRTTLAGTAKCALHHRIADLLGQGGAVHQHGIDAAGLGDQRHDSAVLGRQRAVDDSGHRGRAGKHHTGYAGRRHQRRAHRVARAMQQLQNIRRHTGRVQQFDGLQRHRRGLLGRLGQHAVAGRQRRRDLADEDRQRKVPRADTHPRTARGQAQFVRLTSRPRHDQRRHDAYRLARVVTQKVHRLAQLTDRVAPGLERLLDQQRTQARQLLLHRIGRLQQHCRALRHVSPAPLFVAGDAARHRCGNGRDVEHRHRHDLNRGISRQQRRTHRLDRQVQAGAVFARGAVQFERQWQRGFGLQPQRRNQQLFHADRLVRQLVHKRRVGPVLQQASHQIGQQVLVRTHRSVDPAGDQRVLQHLAVHTFPHAMQPLQFKLTRPHACPCVYCAAPRGSRALLKAARCGGLGAGLRCHLQDGRNGGCVVRGELRINRVRRFEQSPGAGQVGHVGMVLVGEYRVSRQAHFLRALDLGVPIRAFDQPAHQPNFVFAPDGGHMLDQFECTGLVRLHRQAEAGPLRGMLRDMRRQGFEHLQRQLQPVHFLGVDGEVDIGCCGLVTQQQHARNQLGHDTGFLRVFITRVQGAELDGNAVVVLTRAVPVGVRCNGSNGVLVTGHVFERVGIGARALAQHVIAESKPPRLRLRLLRCPPWEQFRLGAAGRRNPQIPDPALGASRFVHRLADRLAQHELAAQQLHRAQCGGHYRTRAQLGQHATGRLAVGQELLAHRNGGARQARQRLVAGCREVGAAELIGGQRNRGLGIGHAQQRLGQAHQCQALGAGDRVFLEQAFHGPERRRVLAYGVYPGRGDPGHGGPVQRGGKKTQALGDDLAFGTVRDRQAHVISKSGG